MNSNDIFEKLKVLADIDSKDFEEFCHELMMKASDGGHKVPILAITIDLEKYNTEHGGSCTFDVIPDLYNDEHIKQVLFELTDYIRENYDCNKFVEV